MMVQEKLAAAVLGKGVLGVAAKDAYDTLKAAVSKFVRPDDVASLEQSPTSQARRDVLAEELAEAGRTDDPALADLATRLLAVLKADGATGVALEEVEAINIRLSRIVASGTGVSLRRTKAAGNIEIEGVIAGHTLGKN